MKNKPYFIVLFVIKRKTWVIFYFHIQVKLVWEKRNPRHLRCWLSGEVPTNVEVNLIEINSNKLKKINSIKYSNPDLSYSCNKLSKEKRKKKHWLLNCPEKQKVVLRSVTTRFKYKIKQFQWILRRTISRRKKKHKPPHLGGKKYQPISP